MSIFFPFFRLQMAGSPDDVTILRFFLSLVQLLLSLPSIYLQNGFENIQHYNHIIKSIHSEIDQLVMMTLSGKPNSAAVPWQRLSVSASVFGGVWILLPISFIYQSDVHLCGDCIIPRYLIVPPE
jgi:hypothetical protein